MDQIRSLIQKSKVVLKEEGFSGFQKRVKHYRALRQENKPKGDTFKDILFINGCPREYLLHPVRYRVDHQKEQCIAFGLICDEVYYQNLSNDMIPYYRGFVIFRAPYSEKLESFIQQAHQWNKKVFYDIDDLVFDTKYTNQIPHVQQMDKDTKERYDENVYSMGKVIKLCDGCITSTPTLQNELLKLKEEVFLNRNTVSMEMVSLSQNAKNDEPHHGNEVHIGYFSGSITHNADFALIEPVLCKILNQYPQVRLHLVGELDSFPSLQSHASQVEIHPFMDWKQLPTYLAKMDINLAPLEDTIFNRAKSEIKWIEASLVKVMTIASDVGAFHECIEQGKTGILCENNETFEKALIYYINHPEDRNKIAKAAYEYCLKHCVTIYTGYPLVSFLQEQLKKQIVFAIPKVEISGGIMVVLQHMSFLQDHGWDVSFLTMYETRKLIEDQGHSYPILNLETSQILGEFQVVVATMWTTVQQIEELKNARKKLYFVQNFETDFYNFEDPLKLRANQSYMPQHDIVFYTMSKWCQDWLKKNYGKDSFWVLNGIDLKRFTPEEKSHDKIRILIEGDCLAEHKNVDESFKIIDELDHNQFEIWYMSYNASPKDWYHVDHFFHKVPYEEVPKIYQSCDILLKTSLLESFSYPPLEMMATGGQVVAILNDGNQEYLQDRKNCLIYPQGDIKEAVRCIHCLCENQDLRDYLKTQGIQTAKDRDWKMIEPNIVLFYESQL